MEKLLGRKVDKSLTYPLEKYLDPNRPYKCDVCKESFTQKNILLVHYNSVSHLHKLKKTMQEQQNREQAADLMNRSSSSLGSSGGGSSLENAINNLRKDEDDASKVYKCNICKVAYSQGSTLDIHIRSVLHQTRASKLQELAMTGQIDLSKPLIEQPDAAQIQEQQKKIFSEMLSPKSLNSSGSSQSMPSPTLRPPSPSSLTPQSSPMATIQKALGMGQGLLGPKSLSDMFAGQDQLTPPQQQLAKLLQALPGLQNSNLPSAPGAPGSPLDERLPNPLFPMQEAGNKPSPVLKNLLQNYGFELVMQFNEYHQRRKQKEEEERRQKEQEKMEVDKEPVNGQSEVEPRKVPENGESSKSLPEIKKSKCPVCDKEFSSIWVLKAHSEEIHKDAVPPDFLEKYIEELKSKMDDDSKAAEAEPSKSGDTSKDETLMTPEKSSAEEPNLKYPETSTPKSGKSTPAPNPERPSRPSSSVSQKNSSSPKPALPEIPAAFQQALLAAQQQSQSINPMMLQMSQLQNMNPLVAMNLQPPLMPPNLLQNGPGSSGLDPMMQALLSQIQSAQGQIDPQMQMLAKLGIDPKAVAQSGMDPKVLMQLGQMDPKQVLQGNADPKLLALLKNPSGAAPDKTPPPQGPDPKTIAQMQQMGILPQAPDPKLLMHLAKMGGENKPGAPTPPAPPFLGGFPPFEPPSDPKSMMMPQKPVFQQPEQAKRARTRITDDQLKVLRSNFDINNSPTEEMINTMAAQTGLPHKVIKHWFRNTLFKERQRNKDSPYNFANPPSTMLNLEEYEKTGEPKVISLNPEEQKEYTAEKEATKGREDDCKPSEVSDSDKPDLRIRSEESLKEPSDSRPNSVSAIESPKPTTSDSPITTSHAGSVPTSGTSSPNLNLSSILNNPMGSPLSKPASFLPHPLVPNFPGAPPSLPGQLPNFLNPLANIMSNEQPPRQRSPQPSPGGISQGKRANRTRFTDYQIKVLQEFFENNAYPKDDDLEYLSKLLSLSPRVIVVWFQNARQKARKIYENQPPLDPNDDGAGRFTRTPGLNYQCKKCLLVFQRYYELIRHQKQHCFKEEDAKRSAQAQKAAAQAAAQFSSQAGSGINMNALTPRSEDSNSSLGLDRPITSPILNSSAQDSRRSFDGSDDSPFDHSFPQLRRESEEKKMTPSMFDQLTREDPFTKFAGHPSGSNLFPSYPPTSPFGMLQQQALQNTSRDRDSDDLDNESIGSSPSSSKRKHSDDGEIDDKDESGQPRDKRLRTTILPEQLDYLYQKYQIESNPSRKMLEQIATEVGLRKRVVQVWFQNTRARERKGQFRAHQQVINKRCPFCPALFKVRSALESHLATKHADQYTRGEINIDALPDAEGIEVDSELRPGLPLVGPPTSSAGPPMPPFSSSANAIGESMRKYYEDTMKRYMNDLQKSESRRDGQAALDLSSTPPAGTPEAATSSSVKDNDNDGSSVFDKSGGDDRSDSMSENNLDNRIFDFEGEDGASATGHLGGEGSPASPSATQGSGKEGATNKRFRTQMSTIQVKVMKSVFTYHKTPTMAECANLGSEIGLQKRVVQVWFQNARAKEKKARLQLQQATGQEPETPPPPEECHFCNFAYSHKFVIQEHLFSKGHLDNIRIAIEEGRYEPESPGHTMAQAAAALTQNSTDNKDQADRPSSPSKAKLPLLQLANQSGVVRLPPPPTLPLPPHLQPPTDTPSGDKSKSDGNNENREEMEKTLMQQIYGMNHGINSYPTGVAQANPFLHPAMFSATSGKSDHKTHTR